MEKRRRKARRRQGKQRRIQKIIRKQKVLNL